MIYTNKLSILKLLLPKIVGIVGLDIELEKLIQNFVTLENINVKTARTKSADDQNTKRSEEQPVEIDDTQQQFLLK